MAILAQPERRKDKDHQHCFFFVCVCFVSFSRSFVNKD